MEKTRSYPGGIDPVKGPFTYSLREIPQDEVNRLCKIGYEVGPELELIETDGEGNEYVVAEFSPLVDPATVKRIMRKLKHV